ALPDGVAAVLAASADGTTVTDVGSTKATVVAAARSPRFVGGHPICGLEAHGPERATAAIFDGATWFLTPTADTDPARCPRPRRLRARARLGRRAGRAAGGDRRRRARPARRAHEPPAARARERRRQPGRRRADRGARAARERRRLAPRHDAHRRREPADLG